MANRNIFSLKAIETRYKGYKFRSRIEARWAVFFDEIGIKYSYEKEGYALDGIPYLPDFYLPQQDCFVEIKGIDPDEREEDKARLLSLYAGKNTYIFSGNIPYGNENQGAICCSPPEIYTTKQAPDKDGQFGTHTIKISKEVLIVIQKLYDAFFDINLKDGSLAITSRVSEWYVNKEDINLLLYHVKKQNEIVPQVFPLLEQYEKEIIQALTPDNGWDRIFVSQSSTPHYKWVECKSCKELKIVFGNHIDHAPCQKFPYGSFDGNSPRLTAAYEAARQARF